jgi:hypothetical protein
MTKFTHQTTVANTVYLQGSGILAQSQADSKDGVQNKNKQVLCKDKDNITSSQVLLAD